MADMIKYTICHLNALQIKNTNIKLITKTQIRSKSVCKSLFSITKWQLQIRWLLTKNS